MNRAGEFANERAGTVDPASTGRAPALSSSPSHTRRVRFEGAVTADAALRSESAGRPPTAPRLGSTASNPCDDDPVTRLAAALANQTQSQRRHHRADPATDPAASEPAAAASAGTAILDALLALTERTAVPWQPAATGPEERAPSAIHDISAESKASSGQAEAEVSIEHVSVVTPTQYAAQQAAPEVVPLTPEGQTNTYLQSVPPPGRSSTALVAGHNAATTVSSASPAGEVTLVTAAKASPPQQEGQQSQVNAAHPQVVGIGSSLNTSILNSIDGTLHDVAAAGGAWRSQFAANAQRLLRETQQQVQSLLFYKEAYEASLAAHREEQAVVERWKREREAEQAAHAQAMDSLSEEALSLSREVGTLRGKVETLTHALQAVQRERDAAAAERDALAVKVDAAVQAAASEAETTAAVMRRMSLELEEKLAQLQRQLGSLEQEKRAVELQRDQLEKANVTWESRLFRERRRWRAKSQQRHLDRSDDDEERVGRPVEGDAATTAPRSADELSGISSVRGAGGGGGVRSPPTHLSHLQSDESSMFPELTQVEQDSLLESIGAAGIPLRTENERVLLRHIYYLTQELRAADQIAKASLREAKKSESDRLHRQQDAGDSKGEWQRKLEEECERLQGTVASLQHERDDLTAALEAARLRLSVTAGESPPAAAAADTQAGANNSSQNEVQEALSLSRQLRAARQRTRELETTVRAQRQQLAQQEQRIASAGALARDASAAEARQVCARQLRDLLLQRVLAVPGNEHRAGAPGGEDDSRPSSTWVRLVAFLQDLDERGGLATSEQRVAPDYDLCLDALDGFLCELTDRRVTRRQLPVDGERDGDNDTKSNGKEGQSSAEAAYDVQERLKVLETELVEAQKARDKLRKELQAVTEASSTATENPWLADLTAVVAKQHQLLVNATREYAPVPVTVPETADRADDSITKVSLHHARPHAPSLASSSAPPLTTADGAKALLQQAEDSHRQLLRLLTAVRELKRTLQQVRHKLKDERREHDHHLSLEKNRAAELEGRLTTLAKGMNAAEAKKREEAAALQQRVEERLTRLLAQLDTAEAECAQRREETDALQQQLRESGESVSQLTNDLSSTRAELRSLTREHITFTESLRDVVAERDELLAQRQGLVEATKAMERDSAADREGVLLLYALLTQWTRWVAWVMLRLDVLQLQKQWLHVEQRGMHRELAEVRALAEAWEASTNSASSSPGDVHEPEAHWQVRALPQMHRPRGMRRLRVACLAVLAVAALQSACEQRRQILQLKKFFSISITVHSASATTTMTDESEDAADTSGQDDETPRPQRARHGQGKTPDGVVALTGGRDPSEWRGTRGPSSGSVPRVVFLPEDATSTPRDWPSPHDELDHAATRAGDDGGANRSPQMTAPFLSTLSFTGSRMLAPDRLRATVVLPDTSLPPLHELLASVKRLFKPGVSAAAGEKDSASCKHTANTYDLVEYLLHVMSVRFSESPTISGSSPPDPFPQSLRALPSGVEGPAGGKARYERYGAQHHRNQCIPRATQLLTNAFVTTEGSVAGRLEALLERQRRDLCDADTRRKEAVKDLDVLAGQNRDLGRALEARSEAQDAIAQDLAALEELVRSRPTLDELQALRERLLAVGNELQRERELRQAEQDRAAQYQEREMALLSVQQQLKNEIRSLTIELGRAAAVRHNGDAARLLVQPHLPHPLVTKVPDTQPGGTDGVAAVEAASLASFISAAVSPASRAPQRPPPQPAQRMSLSGAPSTVQQASLSFDSQFAVAPSNVPKPSAPPAVTTHSRSAEVPMIGLPSHPTEHAANRASVNPLFAGLVSNDSVSTPNASYELYEPMALHAKRGIAQERAPELQGTSSPHPQPNAAPSTVSTRSPISPASSELASRGTTNGADSTGAMPQANDVTAYQRSRRATPPMPPYQPTNATVASGAGSPRRDEPPQQQPFRDVQRPVISLRAAQPSLSSDRRTSAGQVPVAAAATAYSDSFSPSPRPQPTTSSLPLSMPVRPLRYDSSDSREALDRPLDRSANTNSRTQGSAGAIMTAGPGVDDHSRSVGAQENLSYDDRYVSINPTSTASVEVGDSVDSGYRQQGSPGAVATAVAVTGMSHHPSKGPALTDNNLETVGESFHEDSDEYSHHEHRKRNTHRHRHHEHNQETHSTSSRSSAGTRTYKDQATASSRNSRQSDSVKLRRKEARHMLSVLDTLQTTLTHSPSPSPTPTPRSASHDLPQ